MFFASQTNTAGLSQVLSGIYPVISDGAKGFFKLLAIILFRIASAWGVRFKLHRISRLHRAIQPTKETWWQDRNMGSQLYTPPTPENTLLGVGGGCIGGVKIPAEGIENIYTHTYTPPLKSAF